MEMVIRVTMISKIDIILTTAIIQATSTDMMPIKAFRKSTKVTTENHHPKNHYQKVDLEIGVMIIEEGTMIAVTEIIAGIEEILDLLVIPETTEVMTITEVASTKDMMIEVDTSPETMMIETIPAGIIIVVEILVEEVSIGEILILLKNSKETILEIEFHHIVEEVTLEITSQAITEEAGTQDPTSKETIAIRAGIISEVVTEEAEVASEEEEETEVATEVTLEEEAEVADLTMMSLISTPLMRTKLGKLHSLWLLILVDTTVIINKWVHTLHILKTDS